jgi:hypothetical protein
MACPKQGITDLNFFKQIKKDARRLQAARGPAEKYLKAIAFPQGIAPSRMLLENNLDVADELSSFSC